MKKDRYIFPAVFDYADDGISVEFPDLPGCLTCGSTIEEAISMAKEALGLHLYGMEQDNEVIPEPTKINVLCIAANQVVMLVEVWMPLFRDAIENKAEKTTLTLPKWLKDLGEANHVNFSQLLQKALKEHLGISESKK